MIEYLIFDAIAKHDLNLKALRSTKSIKSTRLMNVIEAAHSNLFERSLSFTMQLD